MIIILSWMLYGVALILKTFANHVRFMSPPSMPLAFRYSSFSSKYWVVRLLITYGSLLGIWFKHGLNVLIGAFAFYLLISAITFFRGSKSAINNESNLIFEILRKQAAESGQSINAPLLRQQAQEQAIVAVRGFLERNGQL